MSKIAKRKDVLEFGCQKGATSSQRWSVSEVGDRGWPVYG
jgi:hypothetical protein